ncbi:TIGR03905 family TSCPD domain-containing protein [Cellulosilyticum ruminicola]|uniref:TIGR03905 family TSCPD domain-containing protein n=1 Tax=Cellulosilyticum ruminicola TaxID=425254 RepID=UPI000A444D88|nr:TIGR03905 family TSCPD domain-containing protein [Cellulosilyticum ruminicola]
METYKTSGVCSTEINFEVKDGIIENVEFVRGCPGNTLGLTALLKGMKVQEAVKRLKGIDCRGRGTSCQINYQKR